MINYHTGIDTLSIWSFDQISKTGNISLLLHDGEKEFPWELAYKKDGEWKKYGGGELNPEYELHEVIENDDQGNEAKAKFSVDSIKLWSIIYNAQQENIGSSKELTQARRLRAKATRLYEDVYCKGHRWKKTFAKLADRQADDIFQRLSENDYSLEKTCASLSKYMGFDIDSKKTTCEKFNSYLDLVKKETE